MMEQCGFCNGTGLAGAGGVLCFRCNGSGIKQPASEPAAPADDGRALLRTAKAQMQESHDWVSDRNQKWGLARAMQAIDEILASLAAPEQPAPLCSECGGAMPVPLAHCCESAQEVQAHYTDPARGGYTSVALPVSKPWPGGNAVADRLEAIARGLTYNDSDREGTTKHWLFELAMLIRGGHTRRPDEERMRRQIERMRREFAAGKAAAEAQLERLHYCLKCESEAHATERGNLRAKLADAEKRATNWRDGHDRLLATCEDLREKLRAAEQEVVDALDRFPLPRRQLQLRTLPMKLSPARLHTLSILAACTDAVLVGILTEWRAPALLYGALAAFLYVIFAELIGRLPETR